MVDHRHAKDLAGPIKRIRIASFAGQEQRPQRAQVIPGRQLQRRVVPLDCANRGRSGKQRVDPMLPDDAPERSGVRRPYRLAFIKNGRGAGQQRAVDDVGMSDHPTNVGRRPEYVARRYAVERLHRPMKRNRVPAVVPHDPLGLAGGTGGVEDIQGIGRPHRDAVGGRCISQELRPVQISPRLQVSAQLRSLQQDDEFRGVICLRKRVIQQGLVSHHAVRLQAATGGEYQLWLRLGDPGSQLASGEASENHRMDHPEPRAGQHRHDRLGNHGHVDQRAIAALHTGRLYRAGQLRHPVAKFRIGEPANGAGHGAVVNQRGAVCRIRIRVPVQRVIAGVQHPTAEPPARRRAAVQNLARRLNPFDTFGRLVPKALRIGQPTIPNAVIGHSVFLLLHASIAFPQSRARRTYYAAANGAYTPGP